MSSVQLEVDADKFSIKGRIVLNRDGGELGIVRHVAYDPMNGFVLLVEKLSGKLIFLNANVTTLRPLPPEADGEEINYNPEEAS